MCRCAGADDVRCQADAAALVRYCARIVFRNVLFEFPLRPSSRLHRRGLVAAAIDVTSSKLQSAVGSGMHLTKGVLFVVRKTLLPPFTLVVAPPEFKAVWVFVPRGTRRRIAR